MSSSSTPSYSPAPYSADESGYVTGRPWVNPLNIRENENRSSSESEHEVTSARDPYDGPRASPTPLMVQSNPRGPRTRLTARKSVPIPRRVSLRSNRPEAPEPSRASTTWPGEQHLRAMATELHDFQVRVTHQGCVLTELLELHQLLTDISAQALESARLARRTAMRATLACTIGGMVLFLLVLPILINAYLGRY